MASSIKFSPKLLAVAFCAASFSFLSCSGDDDGGNGGSAGSGSDVLKFAVKDITPTYIEYVETDTYYECTASGLKEAAEEYADKVYYSINNKVMSAKYDGSADEYATKFNGNSTEIIGTWTRTKNKALDCNLLCSCEKHYNCTDFSDVTKLVVSTSQISATYEYCRTDEFSLAINSNAPAGWTLKIIDCNNIEYVKGSNKVKVNYGKDGYKVTYGNKSCTRKSATVADRRDACNKAIADCRSSSDSWCLEDTYWDYRDEQYEVYYKCERELLPSDFYYDDDEDDGLYKTMTTPKADKTEKNLLNFGLPSNNTCKFKK